MSNVDLASLYPVDDGDIARLQARLAAAAEHDDFSTSPTGRSTLLSAPC